MTWQRCLEITGVVGVALLSTSGHAAGAAASQAGAATAAAALDLSSSARFQRNWASLSNSQQAQPARFSALHNRGSSQKNFHRYRTPSLAWDAPAESRTDRRGCDRHDRCAVATRGSAAGLAGCLCVLKAGSQARDGRSNSYSHPDVVRDEIGRCECRPAARGRTQVTSRR